MHPGSSHPKPSAPFPLQEPAAVLEDLGAVVLNDDQNLIIWSEDKEAMSHAAQSLQDFWRARAPAVTVEHFTGDQRLALLSHINQGIAQLGLNQSMQKPLPPYLPKQIAIITHAEQLPASDVQMLQDLTRHLPGLCWRWVLLSLENPGGYRSAAVTSVNAREPHSEWMAERAPAPAPPVPVVPGEPVEPFFEPTAPLASAELVAAAQTAAVAEAPETPQAAPGRSFGQPAKRWAWLGLALLVLSAWGAWYWIGKHHFAPASAPEPASAPAPTSAPAPDTPPLPSASATQQIDPVADNTTPNQASEAVTATAAAQPDARSPTQAPADPSPELPDVALRGVRWLAQQSPEFYVLEHGAFQTVAQAQSLIRSRDELVNARVLMRKNAAPDGRFLVITGPFRSQDRAQNYKVRENLPPQIPVRRVSDLLQESAKAAP
jgi:hypothetical protein